MMNEFAMGGFVAQKGLWNLARETCCRTEVRCLKEKVTLSESTMPCMKKFLSSWLMEVGQDKKERWRWTGRLKKR